MLNYSVAELRFKPNTRANKCDFHKHIRYKNITKKASLATDLQQNWSHVAHDLQQKIIVFATDLQQKSCIFAHELKQTLCSNARY